jgi:hypothetical protein
MAFCLSDMMIIITHFMIAIIISDDNEGRYFGTGIDSALNKEYSSAAASGYSVLRPTSANDAALHLW